MSDTQRETVGAPMRTSTEEPEAVTAPAADDSDLNPDWSDSHDGPDPDVQRDMRLDSFADEDAR